MTRTAPLRVLIADDSAIYRRIVQRCVENLNNIEVVGTAANGREAVDQVAALSPDLLLLDVSMPVMDGPQALKELQRRQLDVATIIVSGVDPKTARSALEAVSSGAFEFVVKPQATLDATGEEALTALLRRAIDAFRLTRTAPVRAKRPARNRERRAVTGSFDGVVIGVSTGGPAALGTLIPRLTAGFPLPILIVQHIPPGFSDHLVQTLARSAKLQVREGRDNHPVAPGQIVFAPGDQHMTIAGGRMRSYLRVREGAPVNNCIPSVDRLFESAATCWGERTLAVVMTGMGRDGLAGARAVRAAGGTVLCQDEASCAVYGMPRAVVEAGEADEVLPLNDLAERIQFLAGKGSRRWAG